MPSGYKIDWSSIDTIIHTHLPSMTIVDFTNQFLPHISTKAVGARARKLGITPQPYVPSILHKTKIASKLHRVWTPQEDAILLDRIHERSIKELAIELRIDKTAIWRRLKELGYQHSKAAVSKKHSRRASETLARPDVKAKLSAATKGRILSEDTKRKIGNALIGNKNGQYGRGMTKEEKEKWRTAYFSSGINKMRMWLQSPTGISSLAKMITTTRSKKFRNESSLRISELVQRGVIKTDRGHGCHLTTEKGGSFYTKSTYETRYARQLDSDSAVIRFFYEPLRIPYEFENIQLYYIPDFLVEYYDGHEELVEVKPAKLVNLPKNVAKIEAGRLFHTHFIVVTEESIF